MDAWTPSHTGDALPELLLLDWVQGPPSPIRGFGERTSTARMPDRAPAAGEQYRFHFDMGAVHRLQVLRRRLQRAERQPGGDQLAARRRDRRRLVSGTPRRSYLSMGCNHCLEPTCLEGCPVDAYSKDPITGIVRHSADACIGCQVLHLELLVRRPAVQPRARRRRQVRHVPRPSRRWARRPRASAPVRRARIADRDRQRRRVARGGRVDRRRRSGCPASDGSLSTTRVSRCRTTCRRTPGPRDITHVTPEHAALVARRHDRADAALGRRVRDRSGCCSCSACSTRLGLAALVSLARRRPRARGRDVAPRAAGARLSRAADVAAFVAEPRSAAVRGVLRTSPRSTPVCLWFAAARQRAGRRPHGRCSAWPASRPAPASTACRRGPPGTRRTRCAVQPHRWRARAALRRGRRSPATTRWLAIGGGGDGRALRRRCLALRFFRAASPRTASSCKGTARLLSTVLASRLVLRGAAAGGRRHRAAAASPAGLADGPGRLADARCAARRARRRDPRPLPVLRQRRAQASGRALCRGRQVRPHDPQAAARTRHPRRSLHLQRRPGRGLRLGAEDSRSLGVDHLRLLLGGLRHVHRRQGRPRRQRARQPRSSRSTAGCSARRACPSTTRSHRQPRALSAAAPTADAHRRASSWDDALDDDGGAVPRRAGAPRRRRRRRHQHRPARDRGVLRARQAGAARPRHAELRRQHHALHVHGGGRLQALVRQRRPSGRLRGPRARRRHPADRRQHRREPPDPLLAPPVQSRHHAHRRRSARHQDGDDGRPAPADPARAPTWRCSTA